MWYDDYTEADEVADAITAATAATPEPIITEPASSVAMLANMLSNLDIMTWTVDREADWYNKGRLSNAAGEELYIEEDTHAHRFIIRGGYTALDGTNLWPYVDYDHRNIHPRISTALDRGVKPLAQAIIKRFLPEYRDLRGQTLARKADTDAYNAAKDSLAASLAYKMKVTAKDGRFRISSSGRSFYGDVDCGKDTATIKLHGVPADLARTIIDLIAAYK